MSICSFAEAALKRGVSYGENTPWHFVLDNSKNVGAIKFHPENNCYELNYR